MSGLRKLLIIFLLAELFNQRLAVADYRPPEREPDRSQSTESASTRGCPLQLPSLRLAAPEGHIAVTQRRDPRFLFRLSGLSPAPIQVSVSGEGARALWQETLELGQTQGFIEVPELPLLDGETYALAVYIPCGLGLRPSQGVNLRLLFRYRQGEGKAGGAGELAREGVWYDALWRAHEENPSLFERLLRQIRWENEQRL